MVEGRSKRAFKTWLAARAEPWLDGIEVVAMTGFPGFKTATAEEFPDAVAAMDPFHVVRLAGDALDRCRATGSSRPSTRAQRPQGPPALPCTADAAHRCRPGHQRAEGPPRRAVCHDSVISRCSGRLATLGVPSR